jgi:beta-glucanase (GH16 family)
MMNSMRAILGDTIRHRGIVVRQRCCFHLAGAALALAMLGGASHPAYAVTNLVWSDEFDGASVDTSKWTFDIGNGSSGWGNWEREYYTSRTNNAYIAGGVLHIVARKETYGGFPYTSARMKTQGLYWKKYGSIEFRAKLPQGLGFWPALWMLGTNVNSVGWPACGEIDVMENNGSYSNRIGVALHYSDASNNHLSSSKSYILPGGGSVTNFHTYGLRWATNSMSFYVDSQLVTNWTSWSSSTGPYPAPYNQPFFFLMNLAVGGSYLGYPSDDAINASTTFPGEVQVDYVRVYDDTPPVVAPEAPTSLTASPGNAKVFLSWDASTSGATGYNVKRATTRGGPYTPIASPATSSYTDSGVVNCATYYYVVSATNSVGQSPDSSETSVTLGGYALAVNSGGSAAGQFIADANVTGGTVAAPTAAAISTTGLSNPAPQEVYQTERYGTFTYTFGSLTTDTAYKVRLHLVEYYWTAANQRRFNVSINGAQVLTNFDIFATAGGQNKATAPEFMITPNASGQIIIQFTVGSVDQPKSSGIEILAPPPVPPTGLEATRGDSEVALSWSPSPVAQGYNVKRATTSGGPYTILTNGLASTAYTDASAVNGTTYSYVVSAISAGCESADSVEASATPLTPFAQWQMQYFRCISCPEADAATDPDGDGQNNLAEFMAGTDPTDSGSSFRITSIAAEGNDIRVTWTMGSDRTNALQATSGGLAASYSTNFADIFTVTNTVGSVTNYLEIGAATNGPARYYRVRLVP